MQRNTFMKLNESFRKIFPDGLKVRKVCWKRIFIVVATPPVYREELHVVFAQQKSSHVPANVATSKLNSE